MMTKKPIENDSYYIGKKEAPPHPAPPHHLPPNLHRSNISRLPQYLVGQKEQSIAVIAGVTAWNVYDSCQMLKDLNELSAEFELHQHLEEKREVCGIKVPTKEEILAEMQENWIIAYESARDAVNHAADEIPEIPELSLSVKRYWAMLMETLEKFMASIPDFFKDW